MTPLPSYPIDLDALRARVGSTAEIIRTSETTIACNGSGGTLGHPRVFYTLNAEGYAECGYCDRVFVAAPDTE